MSSVLATPSIVIDAAVVRRNVDRMAGYARQHGLGLRPHTKTHKSKLLARMQLDAGAIGLTVAKPGEAIVMAEVCDDLLMAYPAVDPRRCAELAAVARTKKVRVAVDSAFAVDVLAEAARSARSVIGILVDLDVGNRRTGVQSAQEAMELARHVSRSRGVRLDGLMFYPGQMSALLPDAQESALRQVNGKLEEAIELWSRDGLEATIVSGGSTPSGRQSHFIRRMTEFRPGTYVFNDMNCVHGRCATLDDCAARIVTTVVSTAVPGQIVLDAGSKTLSSDRCGLAPDSGHGYVVEFPAAKIFKLSEEHAQVDVAACERAPKVGDRVTVIPNHICPCINLQDRVWWQEPDESPRPIPVDARGRVY